MGDIVHYTLAAPCFTKPVSSILDIVISRLKHKCRVTYLVINSNEWVVWRESTGGPLPVHQQRPLLPIDHVLLHFGNIVRNIINHMQVQVVRGCVEDFRKSLGESFHYK